MPSLGWAVSLGTDLDICSEKRANLIKPIRTVFSDQIKFSAARFFSDPSDQLIWKVPPIRSDHISLNEEDRYFLVRSRLTLCMFSGTNVLDQTRKYLPRKYVPLNLRG